jgi:hypothetical protein
MLVMTTALMMAKTPMKNMWNEEKVESNSAEATMDVDCCNEVDAMPCIAKLSCEICALMRFYTVQTDNS